ncbi:oxygen-independent coproporphyrinogen III oxidase [Haematospirillum jordaniae]|uniref:oxygen-independent coproporphyrinogen III oxidase n=1 Tax=Haematospirillum jordaniae TaxID=1549855 RepID=UPI0014333AAA|nr:oxygen-independent coproporphyrinogen III oxidase [Haematospirillum jordaniae]NKD84588.1 oxygen-independent coproporphyrinogen III oxidase [Haematospirillum jordaniae]
MNHDLLNKYNLRLPRYTSYPTAPHFSAAVTPDLYRTWLETLDPETPVSLYLHVVYCAEMCWFCGCHTKITKRYAPIAEYLETLLQEIDLVANALPARFTAKHIHFGGGSPTILSAPDFTRLMQRLKNCFSFSPDAETAVELDPRTADEAYIQAMAAAGVNRASVGVQDFNHKVQETVNRIQPFELVASVFKWLRRHGIDRINMDLMYGLPYQTTTSILDTVDRAVSLGPQRISLFGYAHVPWMRKHQTLLPEDCLPGFRDRWEQYEAATKRLHQYGYVSIGLDHFALANDTMAIAQTEKRLNRNFQGYTTDTAPVLLGMGASGIGSLPQGYVANEGEVHAWRRMISGGILPIRRGIAISDEDRMRRMVIERLMCDLEVDLGDIASSFGRGHDYFTPELNGMQDLEKDNLVIRHEHMLRMTEEGRPLVRVAAARFDQYLKQGELKHSKAI